jgi:putative hydrolase of the HAD superfamily
MIFEWIIFDADGTLFDYNAAEFHSLKNTFSEFGVSFKKEHLTFYRQFNKVIWDEFERGLITVPNLKIKRFELLLDELGLQLDAQTFSSAYLFHLSRRHDLLNGAKKILDDLVGNFKLVLMTNGIKEVQRSRLSLSPIRKYFNDIIISDEVGVAKPDKRIFQIAFERMSSPKKNTILMIGDNLSSDIKGGNNFGIPTCWYNPGHLPGDPQIMATYEIRNLNEILTIVH